MEISRGGRNKRGEIPEIISFSTQIEINEIVCLVSKYIKSFFYLGLIKPQGMSILLGITVIPWGKCLYCNFKSRMASESAKNIVLGMSRKYFRRLTILKGHGIRTPPAGPVQICPDIEMTSTDDRRGDYTFEQVRQRAAAHRRI